jgi:hypothetical protein
MSWLNQALDKTSRTLGTDSGDAGTAKATGNILAPGGAFAPGVGQLNPLNPNSAVGRMTKDVGQLNPFNADSTAGKVVNNIGKNMQDDPLKWVAIAAAVATGQTYLIPYINAAAAVTSKDSSPEDWLKEGAKAYLISTGGQYVANNVTGVGPQTDITTGETFAGTGASGIAGSAKAGAVAGNISRNIFATAARKGSTDINSAQIITGAITNEALNEAFKYMPGFSDLSKSDQALAVNAFKVAVNKDSNAAYQLFNQGFDATIKGLNDAAKGVGYRDLNHQNAVNNFVQAQGSTEDIDAFNKIEQSAQDKYDNYISLKNKQDAYSKASETYKSNLSAYNSEMARASDLYNRGTWGGKIAGNAVVGEANKNIQPILTQAQKEMEDNRVQPGALQQADDDYVNARAKVLDQSVVLNTYINEGWDNLSQQKEAAAAGYTTPEAYDTHLADKKAAETTAAEEAARQAAVEEQNRLDAAEAERRANEEAERLRQAGLQENTNVDLNKVVADGDTTDEDAAQAKRVAEFGKDLTGGGVQDLGNVNTKTDVYGENSTGMEAYKYDPANKTYTFTSDDGSTLTLDEAGVPIGFTEKTDTSWTGLTDTNTGNLKLPKLPGGLAPTVKPPAKKTTTTTTTTGTGNTAVTTGAGNTATTTGTGTTTVTTDTGTTTTGLGASSLDSILNLLGGTGGGEQQQTPYTPAQVPVADIKSYYDTIRGIAGENLLAKSKDEKDKYNVDELFAEGGTVDDLLRILRG